MLTWYKQSGFRFDLPDGKVLYIDPWEVPQSEPKADLILITHAHYDHFDTATINRLRTDKTIIVAPADVAEELGEGALAIAPGEEQEVMGSGIKAVPAYNIDKSFHPKKNNWVGYVIEIDGQKWYHAGDTDLIPEMEDLAPQTALLPIGGTYTMDAKEAAEAAQKIQAQRAIPMHYGFVVGKPSDAEIFKQLSSVPVEIPVPQIPFRELT